MQKLCQWKASLDLSSSQCTYSPLARILLSEVYTVPNLKIMLFSYRFELMWFLPQPPYSLINNTVHACDDNRLWDLL